MAYVASVPYLLRRRDNFAFRRIVPRHLRARFNRREIKLSLGTCDLSIARRRCRTTTNRFERMLSMVEHTPELTTDEIHKLVRRYMSRLWAMAERDALDDTGLEDEVGMAEMGVEFCDEKLARNQFDGFDITRAQEALGDSMPAPGSPEYLRALNLTLRADREAARMRSAAFQGRYPKPADPLFADLTPDDGRRDDGVTMSALLDRWLGEQERKKKTVLEWRMAVRRFIELHGDLPIRTIIKRHVAEYKEGVIWIPRAATKEVRALPLPEMIKRAPKGADRVKPETVNKHLTAIKSLLSWAEQNDLIENSPARGFKMVRDRNGNSRPSMTVADLNAILSGPVHAEGERPTSLAGEFGYWAVPLGAFTGARLNELGQLRVGDVREEAGIPYLSLHQDEPSNSIKNGRRRRVPVHPCLIELGFLDYVAELRRHGPDALLWPDLKPDCRGRLTGNFSKRVNPYIRACGVEGRGKCFHSLRHSFEDAGRDAEVPEDVRDALVGHSSGRMGRRYGDGHSLKTLAKWMGEIDYPGLVLPEPWKGADR